MNATTNLKKTRCFLILPPAQNIRDITAMEHVVSTLASAAKPLAIEIAGLYGQRLLAIRGGESSLSRAEAQLYSVLRQVELEPLALSDDPAELTAAGAIVGARLVTGEPEFLPIKTWMEFIDQEPLDALLGAFDGLGPGEVALSQVILRGAAPAGWADGHLRQLATLKRRGYGADAPAPMANIAATV